MGSRSPDQIVADVMTFEEVMTHLEDTNRGIEHIARHLQIPREAWRAVLANLLGVADANDSPVAILRLPVRTTLMTDTDSLGRCFLVLSGLFDEHRLCVRAAIRHPGQIIGCMPLLSPLNAPHQDQDPSRKPVSINASAKGPGPSNNEVQPRLGSEVRTSLPSVVVPIAGEHLLHQLDTNLPFARVMLRYLAEYGGDYLDDNHQYDEAFEQYFPGRSGMLTPPPYDVPTADMRVLFCKKPEDPKRAAEMLPPGANWVPGMNFYMLVCTEMCDIRPRHHREAGFSYHEVAVFVPARYGLDPRIYFHVPHMFPDNIMAIFLGREILGLPKLRAANFHDRLCQKSGLERFLMRRMLISEGKERVDSDGERLPTQVDVMDLRWTTVASEHELGCLTELIADIASQALPSTFSSHLTNPIGKLMGDWLEGLRRSPQASPLDDLREQVNACLGYVPELFRTVNATAWKRIFAPEVHTSTADETPWRRSDFEVDAVCCTPFPVNEVHKVEVIDFREESGGGLFTTDGFPITDIESVSSFGLRLSVSMALEPGRVVHDYRNDPMSLLPSRREELSWGPQQTAAAHE